MSWTRFSAAAEALQRELGSPWICLTTTAARRDEDLRKELQDADLKDAPTSRTRRKELHEARAHLQDDLFQICHDQLSVGSEKLAAVVGAGLLADCRTVSALRVIKDELLACCANQDVRPLSKVLGGGGAGPLACFEKLFCCWLLTVEALVTLEAGKPAFAQNSVAVSGSLGGEAIFGFGRFFAVRRGFLVRSSALLGGAPSTSATPTPPEDPARVPECFADRFYWESLLRRLAFTGTPASTGLDALLFGSGEDEEDSPLEVQEWRRRLLLEEERQVKLERDRRRQQLERELALLEEELRRRENEKNRLREEEEARGRARRLKEQREQEEWAAADRDTADADMDRKIREWERETKKAGEDARNERLTMREQWAREDQERKARARGATRWGFCVKSSGLTTLLGTETTGRRLQNCLWRTTRPASARSSSGTPQSYKL